MKLTLAKTWQLCLRQWKWIVEQIEAGTELDVCDLKRQWMNKKGFKKHVIKDDCFFCEYVCQYEVHSCEDNCPGTQINKRFNCCASTYHYQRKPKLFYKKLLELNEKRKAKK